MYQLIFNFISTVQNDSELKQSLFECVAYLEEQRQQAKEGKRAKTEVEKEQDKAKKARVNLLRTWSQRELSSYPVIARTQKFRYGKSRDHSTDLLTKTMRRITDRMAAAVEKL